MKNILIILVLIGSSFGFSQVTVTNNQTVAWYIQNVLVGTGITISGVQYNGGPGNVQNEQVGQFVDPTSATGLPDGLILGSGDVTMASQANIGGGSSLGGGNGAGVDTDLASITLNQINDECVVEFDFVPTGDSIVFSYVFASEEYEEYVCGSVNDAFGFFLTGTNPNGANYAATNLALVPDPANPSIYTTTGVSINTVNPGVSGGNGQAANCAALDPNWASYNVFYAGANTGTNYEYDGNTVVLDCRAAVVCGETYHIKLAIGDGGDGAFDSGVFLEGGSFSSPQPIVKIQPLDENGDPIPNNVLPEGCINASILLIKPIGYTDSTFTIDLSIGGTATNGVDYTQLNPQYTIPIGQDTISVNISAALDGIVEGQETLILSTIYVTNCGDSIFISDTLNILDVALNYNLLFNDTIMDCPQDSILITVVADGGIPNINYVWQHSNETSASIWVPANVFGTYYYPVLATDYCSITSFDSIEVTINPSVPPTIAFVDDYIFTCVDQNGVNIAVDSIGNPFDPNAITYTWTPANGALDNINVFPTSATTWFYLTVYDGCNKVTDSVQVDVGTATVDSISILPAQGCSGQGNAAGSISVYPVAANWSYTLVGNGTVVGPQTSNIFTNLAGNLSYNLLATDPQGCILDTVIFVTQANATLNATIDPLALKNTLCFGSADGEAGIINITGGTNTPSPGPFNVTWTHSDGTNIIGGQNIPLNGGDNVNSLYVGNWQVLVVEQNSGCAWSQSFAIGEPDVLTVSVVGSDSICSGTSVGSMNVLGYGGTGNYTVSIVDNLGNLVSTPGTSIAVGLSAGQYNYTINDDNGCTASGVTSIVTRAKIKVTFDQVNIKCFGRNTGSVNITSAQNYAGSYSDLQFIWTPSITGGDGPGKTSESGMSPGIYVVELQDVNGCISDTIITILDAEPIVLEIDKKSSFCRSAGFQNGNGHLEVYPSGGVGNYSLLWQSLETGESSNVVQWAPLNPGDYKISVMDNNNCLVTEFVTLDSTNVVANFVVTSDDFEGPGAFEGTEPVNIKLQNSSTGFSDVTNPQSDTVFSWNYDAKNSSGGNWFFSYDYNERLDTTYMGEAIYQVCLVAKNYNDCSDTQCVDITVHRQPELLLPNVFTPGAEPNNTFFFPNIGIVEFKGTVYNRYGVKVFEFNDITDEWDGTNFKNNEPCSDGVYYYIFEAKSSNGSPYTGEGHITLIRGKY
ncbi:MAG: choice-of-anchor L domain-containing protein [Crocinitomicaceae bacterium]